MLSAALIAFGVSSLTNGLLLSFATRWLQDTPNARSLHRNPVPRSGGLGLIAGTVAAVAWLGPPGGTPLVLSVLVLWGVSLVDDQRGLPAGLRLAFHVAVAAAFVVACGPQIGSWHRAGLALAIAWGTNAFNFMDGMDGFAGGMASIGFGSLALAAWLGGDPTLASLCGCVAAASLGFLLFNFPPARIFLGDSGSIPLGFCVGALALWGWTRDSWPLWLAPTVFAPFLVDASATLLRRLLCGERVWRPHRSHYYQRLVRMGWTHRRTVLWEYALMVASGGAALVALMAPDRPEACWALALTIGCLYCGLMLWVELRWNAHTREPQRNT